MRKSILLVVIVLFVTCISQAVTMDWVNVGNAGNAADSTGYGAVGYNYSIGKYEVTAGQYTEFLNAVADTDTYGLYSTNMSISQHGCNIQQSGSSGSYTYSVAADWANRPVNKVGWYKMVRFCNWLHNGQGLSDTETGAYTITDWDGTDGTVSNRNTGAQVWVPSEDEWYKAAYHKNDGVTGNYFLYPTSSDSVPGNDMAEGTNAGNNANYRKDGVYLIGTPYYRTEVGEFELSSSPYGTFDMGGNVGELNETLGPGSNRGFRGGAFNTTPDSLRSSARSSTDPFGGAGPLGFRIASVPELTTLLLTSPASRAVLAGTSHDVTWDTEGTVQNVLIEYSSNNGSEWTAVDTVEDTGSYEWQVPAISSDACLIRISDTTGIAEPDTSELFSIWDALTGYTAGDSQVVSINFTTHDTVDLGPSGVYGFRAHDLMPYSDDLYVATNDGHIYRVDTVSGLASEIVNTGNTGLDNISFDASGQLFAAGGLVGGLANIDLDTGVVMTINTSPWFYTSVSAFAIDGANRAVAWDSSSQWLFEVDLSDGDTTAIGFLSGNFEAFDFGPGGTLYAMEPATIHTGHLYSIDVNTSSRSGYVGEFIYENGLSIVSEPAMPLLLSPNGSDLMSSGSIYSIAWHTDESIENVLLEYSTDNGDTWEVIDTVANTGSFDWLVPAVGSTECLVRVSDSLDPSVNDTSDAVFEIAPYETVYFADANLKAAVEAALGIGNPNTNDMLSLTNLVANRLGITDLTGLEYAENLSVAYLHANEISNIELITELSNLTYLHLSSNHIESLPDISSWTRLRYLYLNNNTISDITPLTSPEITTLINLYIYDNELLPIEAYTDYIPAIRANNPNLANFKYDYGCEPMLAGDMNLDCAVNLVDLSIMASDWSRCTHVYQELCP